MEGAFRCCTLGSQAQHTHTTLYVGGTTDVNNTVAKSLNQMAPPARTITVALDMSKYFDTINIHTLIRKLLQINIPGIFMKFITNYIKERKAYTTYRNHTSIQPQFKIGVPQGGLLALVNKDWVWALPILQEDGSIFGLR